MHSCTQSTLYLLSNKRIANYKVNFIKMNQICNWHNITLTSQIYDV